MFLLALFEFLCYARICLQQCLVEPTQQGMPWTVFWMNWTLLQMFCFSDSSLLWSLVVSFMIHVTVYNCRYKITNLVMNQKEWLEQELNNDMRQLFTEISGGSAVFIEQLQHHMNGLATHYQNAKKAS